MDLVLLKDVKATYIVALQEGCLLPEFFPVSLVSSAHDYGSDPQFPLLKHP